MITMDEEEGLLSKENRPSDDRGSDQYLGHCGPCCSSTNPRRCTGTRPGYLASSYFSVSYFVVLHLFCLSLGAYLICSRTQVFLPSDNALLGKNTCTCNTRNKERQLTNVMITADFDRRYPNWVPISYEIQQEDLFAAHESEYTGPPNETNTKAWDDLIIRELCLSFLPVMPSPRETWRINTDCVLCNSDVLLCFVGRSPKDRRIHQRLGASRRGWIHCRSGRLSQHPLSATSTHFPT